MANILLDNVVKHYENSNTSVVKDFSLEIQDKEFVVFVGPSGCGKTTTLRMIAGLEEITAGDLYIGGCRVNDVAPKDRDIAMVFQNYALYPNMTVRQNMAFGLKIRKVSKWEIDQRVQATAAILDIAHLLERKPKELSGGQRQRVALGRAIVREPQVFLMDEPLSNLDSKLRVQMRAEIRKLHQEIKTTTIYVTHDQTEAMTMGDRIVIMKGGVIQQNDSPQQVYNHPSNMFVAGFIGSPAMNFLKGVVVEEGEQFYFRTPSLSILLPDERKKDLRSKGIVGKPVVLGIRPEDLHNEAVMMDRFPEAMIESTIEVVENMGSELYLHVMTGTETLIARVNSQCSWSPGENIKLVLDMNKIHLFDTETEQNIDINKA